MEDILKLKNLIDDVNNNYSELNNRLLFVSKKNKELLEEKYIKNKLVLISSDLRDVVNNMEKTCYIIDEIYANKGTIHGEISNDDMIIKNVKNIKLYNDNHKKNNDIHICI